MVLQSPGSSVSWHVCLSRLGLGAYLVYITLNLCQPISVME